MAEVREWWRDEQLVHERIQKRRLEWLGHRARMQDHRLPNRVLFGWCLNPVLGAGHAGDGGMYPRTTTSRLVLRMMRE